MAEVYDNMIKALIGRVSVKAKADNYFPVVGETVRIDAETRWGQTSEWQTQNGGGGVVTAAGNLILQKDNKSIGIIGSGELQQKFIGKNHLFMAEVVKAIYAMAPQALPYFDIVAEKEVVRVGETGPILIKPENGYLSSRVRTIQARIYKENTSTNPVRTLNFDVGRPVPEGFIDGFTFTEASDRGIYDVEVDVTDKDSGITLSKRINKLITVTPKLCPKPADTSTGYGVVSTYGGWTSYGGKINFEIRLWRNVDGSGLNYAEAILPRGEEGHAFYDNMDISGLPAGTTLCLKEDPQEPEEYMFRFLFTGNQDPTKSNENGTPNFTYEAPLVITHDNEGVWQWGWCSYGAVSVNYNCRNIVFDGRGYYDTSIHFYPFNKTVFTDSCFFVVSGTSDWEMFACDIDGSGFAGINAKTDPNPDMPWWWRENGWEFKNLKVHHCTVRNTAGEGLYFGYFHSGEIKKTNSSGQEVTYHAHIMRDVRVYRCDFIHNGYDSVQINNAVGIEFCYNLLSGCGYRREPNQGSAFSCLMDGKIYNCTVRDNYNILGVFGPFLSRLEIFNSILTTARMEPGWSLAGWSTDENPDTEITGLEYDIHNNIIKAATIARIEGNIIYDGYRMDDNIFITENGDKELPGYFVGSGNLFFTADLDYENIDSYFKVADSANYNYQPAHNSIAVTAGRHGKSPFDMRGYKNWFTKVFHAGPFMGKYKDPNIADVGIIFNSFTLADRQQFTLSQEVKVGLVYNGDAVKYRIGETADLSGVAWIDIPTEGDITYTLSQGFGNKTVYAQVASATEESIVLSTGIVYQATPLSLDSITLSGGFNKTVSVAFNYSGSFIPAKYRLGETADLAGAVWKDYSAEITYTLATGGEKTLYGQIQDGDGSISGVKSASISVYEGNPKIVLSLGWGNEDPGINYQRTVYDSVNKLTKINQSGGTVSNESIFYQDGIVAGTITKVDTQESSWTSPSYKGYTQGDNSGAYLDVILERNIVSGGNTDEYRPRNLLISVSAGRYKIRLLCNTIYREYHKDKFKYQLVADGTEYPFMISNTYTFVNNMHEFIEKTIDVPEGGFNLQWGSCNAGGTFMVIPLNVIEIEKV